MSKALKIVAIGLLSASSLWAQEFIVSEEERREFVPTEPAPLRPSIEGIVKDVFTKKPWQLVNPAAPPEYGSGQRVVSKDFGPGTRFHSTGVVIASVEW